MLRPLCALALACVLAGCNRQPAQQATVANPPVQEAAPVAQPPEAAPPTEAPPPERPVMPGKIAQPRTALIPAGTRIRVRLGQSLDTKTTRSGERFVAHLDQPVIDGDRVVIPRGTPFHGHVVEAKPSGRFKGRACLAVTLDSFQLRGSTYEISTAASGRSSTSHKKRNLVLMGGGSGVGATIGALAGGGAGALIGAGAGAAAGTTGAYITGKKNVKLPAETPLTFSLQHPVNLRG